MSLFCIVAHDAIGSDVKRVELLEKHVEYLQALKQKGRLLAAGPLMSSEVPDAIICGSMLVVDFENQEAVKNWLANEAYNRAGIYQEVKIYSYHDGLPDLD